MTSSSKVLLIKSLFQLSIVVLLALVVTQFIKLSLPQSGIAYQSQDTFVVRHLYRFSNALFAQKVQETLPKTVEEKQQQVREQNYATLESWKLQALFKNGKEGFIVVEVKNETHYLDLGDTLEGYTLKDILGKKAILVQKGIEYALVLDDPNVPKSPNRNTKKAVPKKVSAAKNAELSQGIVHRTDINDYMADTDKIWNNIKLRPYKIKGRIKGFVVRYVRRGSVFDSLGLKNGDIIIEANGVKMTSIKKAEQLYKHIDEIDNVALIITRKGVQKELQYEIK